MNIVVLTGSPHKSGTSALLAENFIKGAQDAGHEVFRFDAAFKNVHPCLGCDKCELGKSPCVFQDDMIKFYPELCKADLIAFITPLYYYGASAQIKTVIDRFHGIDDLLRGADKKAALIVTAGDSAPQVMSGVLGNYHETLHYLKWTDAGTLLALDCYTRADIEATDYPAQAYALGRSMK